MVLLFVRGEWMACCSREVVQFSRRDGIDALTRFVMESKRLHSKMSRLTRQMYKMRPVLERDGSCMSEEICAMTYRMQSR